MTSLPRRETRRASDSVGDARDGGGGCVHVAVRIPPAVHQILCEITAEEQCDLNDLLREGIDSVLRNRGLPPLAALSLSAKGRGAG